MYDNLNKSAKWDTNFFFRDSYIGHQKEKKMKILLLEVIQLK